MQRRICGGRWASIDGELRTYQPALRKPDYLHADARPGAAVQLMPQGKHRNATGETQKDTKETGHRRNTEETQKNHRRNTGGPPLLVVQRLDRIEARGPHGGIEAEDEADRDRDENASTMEVGRHDRRPAGEIADRPRQRDADDDPSRPPASEMSVVSIRNWRTSRAAARRWRGGRRSRASAP